MILVVVRRAGWSKTPWDSYTRTFQSEIEFIDWWTKLPDDSYTKKVSREHDRVQVYRVEAATDLLVPFALPG